jgi:hypothetical protein
MYFSTPLTPALELLFDITNSPILNQPILSQPILIQPTQKSPEIYFEPLADHASEELMFKSLEDPAKSRWSSK